MFLIWVFPIEPRNEFRCSVAHSAGDSLVRDHVISVIVWHIIASSHYHYIFKFGTRTFPSRVRDLRHHTSCTEYGRMHLHAFTSMCYNVNYLNYSDLHNFIHYCIAIDACLCKSMTFEVFPCTLLINRPIELTY